jgi:phage/conjugal plasmid C-4 type zinc finger TraR family protein
MKDIVDVANSLIEIHLEVDIDNIRNNLKSPSLEFCSCCGDEIPKNRREIMGGITMCITCQEISENPHKKHRIYL